MNKTAILAFGLFLFAASAQAQLSFRAGIGYAMPQAGQTLDGTGTPYNGTVSNSTYQNQYTVNKASLSSGIPLSVGFGYMFSDHVGVQLDASFALSTTQYSFNNNNVSYGGALANETITTQAKSPIFLFPALVVQSGGSSPWNIYARAGLALPLKSDVTSVDAYYVSSQSIVDEYTTKLKSSFSLGVTAAAGVQYKINNRMTVWGEVSMLSMSLFLKQSEITDFSENGSSYPLSAIGGSHPVKYSKSVTVDTNYNNLPTYSQPFSNLGISVGISMRLTERRHKDKELMDDNRSKGFKRRKSY